jgi:hypothetical protein
MMQAQQEDDYQPDEEEDDDGGLDNEAQQAEESTRINFGSDDGKTISNIGKTAKKAGVY